MASPRASCSTLSIFDALPPSLSVASLLGQRGILAPLGNHNHLPSTSRTISGKPASGFVAAYTIPQQLVNQRSSVKASSAANAEQPPAQLVPAVLPATCPIEMQRQLRLQFLSSFDYVEMRCHATRVELPKKPQPNELGLLVHSPRESGVCYDTFFQTTHDFLDLNDSLQMYPCFTDLPLSLRPSKVRYDATKQSDDRMLRVRCLFCRGRFGGKNAKAIWERHVKEHWPKPLNVKEFSKEDVRRPVRHAQRRSTGSSAHSRQRSYDSETWVPNGRYSSSARSSSASGSSRADSPTPSLESPKTSPLYLSNSQLPPSTDEEVEEVELEDDDEVVEISCPIRSPTKAPRKRSVYPNFASQVAWLDEADNSDSGSDAGWDIDASLNEIKEAGKPCLDKDQLQAALIGAADRDDQFESPIKSIRLPKPVFTQQISLEFTLDEVPESVNPRKRSRDDDEIAAIMTGKNEERLEMQHGFKRRRTESSASSHTAVSFTSTTDGADADTSAEGSAGPDSPFDSDMFLNDSP